MWLLPLYSPSLPRHRKKIKKVWDKKEKQEMKLLFYRCTCMPKSSRDCILKSSDLISGKIQDKYIIINCLLFQYKTEKRKERKTFHVLQQ